MSLQRTTSALWKKAPIWRGTVVAAAVCTVLAVVVGMRGGSPPPPNPPPTPPNPVKSNPQPPPNPIHGGRVNVVRAVANPGPANDARWTQFETAYDAAAKETKLGARCALMADALNILQQEDLQFYKNDAGKRNKRVEAQSCANKVAESDGRLKALIDAYEATATDSSAQKVAKLARAVAAITAFDRSRNVSLMHQDALAAGSDADAEISQSTKRLTALQTASRNLSDNPGPASLEAFANAAQAVTAFDRAQMNKVQLSVLQRGEKALKQIRESDGRLSGLTNNLRLARGSTDRALRQNLIDSFTALTPFELSRATADQKSAIKEARSLAASFAMEHLVQVAGVFNPKAVDPEPFDRLKSLKMLVIQYGGISSPTAQQAEALRRADTAIARLSGSDRRLRAVVEAAKAWKRSPGPSTEATVRSAYDAIDDFDRARLSEDQRAAYRTLESALTIVNVAGKFPPEKAKVPIYVTARGAAQYGNQILESFRNELKRSGYSVVPAREDAAMIIELSENGIDLSTISFGNRRVNGADATLSLIATWAFDKATFLQATGGGRAAESSQPTAISSAISNATADLFKQFNKRAVGSKGQ